MKATYRTAARRQLVELFSARPDRHFTAEQVCALLCDTEERIAQSDGTRRGEFIGKSTVYRQLARLCDEGLLRRFEDTDTGGTAVHVYQYAAGEECRGHFHLKCTDCGRVIHLECDHTDPLLTHIRAEHGFSVDCGSSILYGRCDRCQRKGDTR